MRLVTVATFWYPAQAHLAKARLEGAGIPCRLANEHTVNVHGGYSPALGGVKLLVPEDAVRAARAALESAEPPEDDDASEYIAVAAFDDPEEAHAAAALLHAAAIPHSLAGEGTFGADDGPVTLAVPLRYVGAAQDALEDV
jgi:hypothetical protein